MAEASTKTVLGNISQGLLECPICCCRFSDPKMLDCLHSFCLNCLDELMSRQQPKADKITCPVCRRETPVPDTGLQGLKNSFFLSSLVDEFNKQEKLLGDTSAPTATCEQCDEGLEAVARCQDCDENMCKQCLDAHLRLKRTKTHHIITVEILNQKGITPKDFKGTDAETTKCTKHINQEVCLYCYTCEMLICLKCAAFDHRSTEHTYSEIADAIGSFRKDVDEVLQKFQKSKEEFKVTKNSIDHARNRLSIMIERSCRDITDKEEEEIAKIRDKSRHLREKVTEIGRERDGRFQDERSLNKVKMDEAEQVVAAVKDLMQQADEFELMDLRPKVMLNLEFQEELRFVPTQYGLSFIGVKCHDIVRDSVLGDILYEEKWHLKDHFLMEDFLMEEQGGGQLIDSEVTEVACFSSGEIAVKEQGLETSRLTVLTPTGLYKNSLTEVEEDEVLGVAISCDDHLFVTNTKKVRVFDSNLQLIHEFVPFVYEADGESESYLTSVAADKKNRIAVVDSGREIISLHSLDGSLISTIPHDKAENYFAISNKERLVFTEFEGNRIRCIDFKGSEIFNIKCSIDGNEVSPFGVCCDDAGDIYVATRNFETDSCEIHHYDPEGVHIERVAKGLYDPCNMTFSPSGELVVANAVSVMILQRV